MTPDWTAGLPEDVRGAVSVARSLLALERSLQATLADVAGGIPHAKPKLDAILLFLEATRAPGGPHELATAVIAGATAAQPDIWALSDLALAQTEAIERITPAQEALEAALDEETADLERRTDPT